MALKKCLTVLSSSALFMFSATSKTKYSMEKHSGRVMTDEEPRPLSPDEKGQVLQLIKLIRDSPSEELFKENQEKLKAMTEGLTVRPGNSRNAVQFSSYYEANWESCAFRWVWAFRRTSRRKEPMIHKLQNRHLEQLSTMLNLVSVTQSRRTEPLRTVQVVDRKCTVDAWRKNSVESATSYLFCLI